MSSYNLPIGSWFLPMKHHYREICVATRILSVKNAGQSTFVVPVSILFFNGIALLFICST